MVRYYKAQRGFCVCFKVYATVKHTLIDKRLVQVSKCRSAATEDLAKAQLKWRGLKPDRGAAHWEQHCRRNPKTFVLSISKKGDGDRWLCHMFGTNKRQKGLNQTRTEWRSIEVSEGQILKPQKHWCLFHYFFLENIDTFSQDWVS